MAKKKNRWSLKKSLERFKKNYFLFEELVKRDFKLKYKRTFFGMLWSVLSPLLNLYVMKFVFTEFFGRNTNHYTIYLFAGNICMAFFREATKNGMSSLVGNQGIITKINVPKYLFLFSRNVSAIINFLLTVVVFFIYCALDGIAFGFHMFTLIYPFVMLALINVGVGMILSALYIFFRDTTYLYDVFLTLLNYVSAIFYTIDKYPQEVQNRFLFNPIYCVIKYVRSVVIDGVIPSLGFHGLLALYAFIFISIGFYMYRHYNHRFVYYF